MVSIVALLSINALRCTPPQIYSQPLSLQLDAINTRYNILYKYVQVYVSTVQELLIFESQVEIFQQYEVSRVSRCR